MKYNTRFAPSPSGDLHLGGARTAYFNWLAARASGGRFILRIDDTDALRSKDEYTQGIIETMKWLGLTYDEIVYQSKNWQRYHRLAHQLMENKQAEYGDGGAIILSEVPNLPKSWKDEIAGDIEITGDDVRLMAKGIVLMKSDTTPTYQWASCIDDMDHHINYIIRGQDHITNTARQIAIWTALGATVPQMAHVGLIHFNGKKLSKRDGAAGMLYYRNAGYSPEAVLNFMVRLGWGPKVDDKTTSLLPRSKMLELFLDGGSLKPSAANMDLQKLDSFNRKYNALQRP